MFHRSLLDSDTSLNQKSYYEASVQRPAPCAPLEGLKNPDGSQKVNGIFTAVPYCIDLIEGPYLETNDQVCKAWRPKKK